MKAMRPDIDGFHNKLERQVADLVGFGVQIGPETEYGQWYRRARRESVFFHMLHGERGVGDFADRIRGGKCRVCQLYPFGDSPRLWMNWREEWVSEGSLQFRPLGTAWTFFWGDWRRPKTQLLRAEWDFPGPDSDETQVGRRYAVRGSTVSEMAPGGGAARSFGGSAAGQPHWHFDSEQLGIALPSTPSTDEAFGSSNTIEELPMDPGERGEGSVDLKTVVIKLGGIHLAMGGWDHDPPAPNCWHHPLNTMEDLQKWTLAVLQYSLGELDRIRTDI
jgi:hypothetical protein